MTRRLSLRARVAVTCAVAIAVALVGMAAAAFLVVDHELYRSLDLDLSRAAILAQRDAEPDSALCQYLAAPPCVHTVSATSADSGPLPVTAQDRAVAQGSAPAYYRDGTLAGFPVRIFTTSGKPGTAIEVALRTDQITESLGRVGLALGIATAIGLAVAVGVAVAAARTGLRPLRALTETAERVAATADPDERIAVGGRDEVARLAGSLNTMLGVLRGTLDSLHRSVAAQRRFVADAAHELRTPLTALRTNAELLDRTERPLAQTDRDRVTGIVRTQVVELSALVDDLLDLARAEDPDANEEFAEVAVDALVRDCVRVAASRWPDTEFVTELAPTICVGVAHRLARAIGNLLDNAAKFGPAPGRVEVSLRERTLSIRDDGPGIAADELPHVFDRFYRGTRTRDRPGAGIGLALVQRIADTHGAEVTLINAESGGALARLVLPG